MSNILINILMQVYNKINNNLGIFYWLIYMNNKPTIVYINKINIMHIYLLINV